MRILNQKEVAGLKPASRKNKLRDKFRLKASNLTIGQAILLDKGNAKALKNPRAILNGVKGHFSIRSYREGVAIQKVK